ncbi:MAG: hypothetical protein ACK5L0_01305 [Candidatus Fimivivens sp.]
MKSIKKAALAAAIVMLSMFSLVGCQQKTDKTTFSATVMRVDETSVLVRPAEDTPQRKSADLISIGLTDAEITDAKGNILSLSSLVIGLKVDITYSGSIAESYPAQIHDCTQLVAHLNPMQLPNPMIDFDSPDFRYVAGFALEGMPESVSTDGIWLISGKIAQLDLTASDGAQGMLRCAKSTDEDISGLYGMQFDTQTVKQFGDVFAELSSTEDGKALARWQRGGYDFILWFPEMDSDTFPATAESIINGVEAVEAI